MYNSIVNFFLPICKKYSLSLNYISDEKYGKEAFLLHRRGRIIQGVTVEQFFQVPKQIRYRELLGLLKRGLSGALDDKSTREQVYIPKRYGKIIIENGTRK
jgi:hypothetical protein